MILLAFSAFSFSSRAVWTPLANHLWQSTLFAGVVWLLTVMLRKNRAQTRYSLWLVASAKFLIPFSLLVGVGSRLAWSKPAAVAESSLFFTMEEISQPFASAKPSHAAAPAHSTSLELAARLLPILLVMVWFCGTLAILFSRWLRWRRIRAAVRWGLALKSGRELDALRRTEPIAGIAAPIDLVISKSTLEPGVIGIFRPVLLLPAGVSSRLTDAQLESILTHELCHVRRHDNLAAMVHMLVEAIFWFHPLIWCVGTRLVDERERACDENVLRLGNNPQVYAQGILKVCEFYVELPLFCAAGAKGSNLKKRIEAIMSHQTGCNLGLGKKLFLAAMGMVAIAGPVMLGLADVTQSKAQPQSRSVANGTPALDTISTQPDNTGDPMARFSVQARPMRTSPSDHVGGITAGEPSGLQPQAKNIATIAPEYEVVSIKPHESGNELFKMIFEQDGFSGMSVTLRMLIRAAYGVKDSQIFGASNLLDSQKYDVEARMNSAVSDALGKMTEDQRDVERQRMLQALLADRFKLTLHRGTKWLGGYVLVIAENGLKLQEAKPGDTYPNGFIDNGQPLGPGAFKLGRYRAGRGELIGQGLSTAKLVRLLSENILNRSVLDNTGLSGNYDFTLQWKIGDESQGPMFKEPGDNRQVAGGATPPEFSGPSFFTAIEEQLGLRLESKQGPEEILVIDHVEKPSEN